MLRILHTISIGLKTVFLTKLILISNSYFEFKSIKYNSNRILFQTRIITLG